MAISVNTGSWYRFLNTFTIGVNACIGIWLRLPNGVTSGSDFNFPMSSGAGGNAPNTSRYAVWGLSTGSPLSFVTSMFDENGVGVFDYDWTLPGPAGVVDDWHLFIVNKVGIRLDTYWVPMNTLSPSPVGTGTSVEGDTILQGMYIGRTDELDSGENNWRNEIGEFFVLDRFLTEEEISELSTGKNITEVEADPVINLQFLTAAETIPDLTGNGYDALRTGSPITVAHPFTYASNDSAIPRKVCYSTRGRIGYYYKRPWIS